MDLKGLIYNKGFDEEAHFKLLTIADSSMWVEDMLDYIHELRDMVINPKDYVEEDDEEDEETVVKKIAKIGGIECPVDG